jgi:hypothetical protein
MIFIIIINVLGQKPQEQLQRQHTENTSNVKEQL